MTEASLTLVVRASKAPLNDPTRLLHRAAQAGRASSQASPLPTARLPLSRGFSESIFLSPCRIGWPPGFPYGDRCVFVANDWHAALVPVYLAGRYRRHGVYRVGTRNMTL